MVVGATANGTNALLQTIPILGDITEDFNLIFGNTTQPHRQKIPAK